MKASVVLRLQEFRHGLHDVAEVPAGDGGLEFRGVEAMLGGDYAGTRFEDRFGARVGEVDGMSGLPDAGPVGARVAGGEERLLRGEGGTFVAGEGGM